MCESPVVVIGYAYYGTLGSNILVSVDTLYSAKCIDYTTPYRHLPTLMNVLHPKLCVKIQVVNNIILDNLYKLRRIRNIDLYDFMCGINGCLVDEKGTVILPKVGDCEKEKYYHEQHWNIRNILVRYPGLFEPIDMPASCVNPIHQIQVYMADMIGYWGRSLFGYDGIVC
jgi:hypothetical protein